MLAQRGEFWLPDIPAGTLSSHLAGSLYPDNLYFDAGSYASDMGLEDGFPSSLACPGFDLAMTLLKPATLGRLARKRLKIWFKDVDMLNLKFDLPRVPSGGLFLGIYREVSDEHFQGPGMCRALYTRLEESWRWDDAQIHAYRQRA